MFAIGEEEARMREGTAEDVQHCSLIYGCYAIHVWVCLPALPLMGVPRSGNEWGKGSMPLGTRRSHEVVCGLGEGRFTPLDLLLSVMCEYSC